MDLKNNNKGAMPSHIQECVCVCVCACACVCVYSAVHITHTNIALFFVVACDILEYCSIARQRMDRKIVRYAVRYAGSIPHYLCRRVV